MLKVLGIVALNTALLAAAAQPARAGNSRAPPEETLVSDLPADVMALIPGRNKAPAFPQGAPGMLEPKVVSGGALLHKIRHPDREVVGFASQMATSRITDQGKQVQDTSWVARMKADPSEAAADIQTTVGPRSDSRGLIVGGSGEFAGCTGSFVEVERLKGYDPANPVALGIVGSLEFRVRFGS